MPSCARSTGADTSLVPGFPLTHPDHAWLVRRLLGRRPRLLAVSAAMRSSRTRAARTEPNPAWLTAVGPAVSSPSPWGCDDRIAKWRAIRRYASQLPLLAMRRSLRRGPHRYAAAPEWIAWGPDYPSTSA